MPDREGRSKCARPGNASRGVDAVLRLQKCCWDNVAREVRSFYSSNADALDVQVDISKTAQLWRSGALAGKSLIKHSIHFGIHFSASGRPNFGRLVVLPLVGSGQVCLHLVWLWLRLVARSTRACRFP
jgi:hypothetical protein